MLLSKYSQIGLGHQILFLAENRIFKFDNILLFVIFTLFIELSLVYNDTNFGHIGSFIFFYIVVLYILYHLFFIVIIPLILRPKIYYNPNYRNINFSQKQLLAYFPSSFFYLITCTAFRRDNNKFKDEKRLITFFVYYDLINLSFKRPDHFMYFFINSSLYLIGGFVGTLIWILSASAHFKFFLLLNYFNFTISIIPVFIYAYYTLYLFFMRERFYIESYNKTSIYRRRSKRNLNLFHKFFLVDKIIEETSRYTKLDNSAFKLVVEIIIAIYFAICIPLIYNNIYSNSTKVVKSITLEIKR